MRGREQHLPARCTLNGLARALQLGEQHHLTQSGSSGYPPTQAVPTRELSPRLTYFTMKVLSVIAGVLVAAGLLSGSPANPQVTSTMGAILTVHGTQAATSPSTPATQTFQICIPCCVTAGVPCAEICVTIELKQNRSRNEMAQDIAEAIRAEIQSSTNCNTLDAGKVKAFGNTVLVPGISGFYTNPCPPANPCNSPSGAHLGQTNPFVSTSYQGM